MRVEDIRKAVQAAKEQVAEFTTVEDAGRAHYLVCVYDHLSDEARAAYDAGYMDESNLAAW